MLSLRGSRLTGVKDEFKVERVEVQEGTLRVKPECTGETRRIISLRNSKHELLADSMQVVSPKTATLQDTKLGVYTIDNHVCDYAPCQRFFCYCTMKSSYFHKPSIRAISGILC